MTFKELRFLWWSDVYRRAGKISLGSFLKLVLFFPGNKLMFWLRLTAYLRQCPIKYVLWPLYIVSRLLLIRYQRKYGIDIQHVTRIGPGLLIGHFDGIVVSGDAIIGRNCNISQGVTIGVSRRGKRPGTPVLGDNVYLGPGAKVFGGITIGKNVAVGANCVVAKDVPDNAVVVGSPARAISQAGSEGLINRTDYAEKLGWDIQDRTGDRGG